MIEFELSGLEESSGNALSHYEIEFSEVVNATWLQNVIKNALLLDSIGMNMTDLLQEDMYGRNKRAEFRIMSRIK